MPEALNPVPNTTKKKKTQYELIRQQNKAPSVIPMYILVGEQLL